MSKKRIRIHLNIKKLKLNIDRRFASASSEVLF